MLCSLVNPPGFDWRLFQNRVLGGPVSLTPVHLYLLGTLSVEENVFAVSPFPCEYVIYKDVSLGSCFVPVLPYSHAAPSPWLASRCQVPEPSATNSAREDRFSIRIIFGKDQSSTLPRVERRVFTSVKALCIGTST